MKPEPPPVASMRPGQSCPGVDPADLHGLRRADRGFNEAGAIMPRSGEWEVDDPVVVRLKLQ